MRVGEEGPKICKIPNYFLAQTEGMWIILVVGNRGDSERGFCNEGER